jgi:DNA replication initiation complex subunit (GINS family)
MITYNDLYEVLRKEKYSETLQPLTKKFLSDFSEYVNDRTLNGEGPNGDLFAETGDKGKKQLENALSLFKELMLRRKKKILNLIFVATETGITKRDYENMLPSEKEAFDKMVRAFEEGDKEISRTLNGKESEQRSMNKMIIFTQDIEQFMDSIGNFIGPFKSGELANIDESIARILVADGKARTIDED